MYQTRKYLIIPTSIINDINFSQVYETSKDTLRYSVDGTKTFIKYDITVYEEDFVQTFVDPETNETRTITIPAGIYGRPSIYDESYPEYTHEQILEILNGEEWTTPIGGIVGE